MGNIELISMLRRAFKLYPQSCYVRTIFLKLGFTLSKKKKDNIYPSVFTQGYFYLFYMNYIRNVSCSSWACEAELFSPLLRKKFTFQKFSLLDL